MTVQEIIARLGGPEAVAPHFRCGASNVRNWCAAKRVPHRHHAALVRLAARAGLAAVVTHDFLNALPQGSTAPPATASGASQPAPAAAAAAPGPDTA